MSTEKDRNAVIVMLQNCASDTQRATSHAINFIREHC